VPQTKDRQVIRPPLFDDGSEHYLNYGNREDGLVTDWLLLENSAYRLSGAALVNAALPSAEPCQDITVDEAVLIVESFAIITDEITGDG
jgi:hypothetical protein